MTPRARYDVEGATGKEVIILDLYQGAGEALLSKEGTRDLNLYAHSTAKAIVAKNIHVRTLSGAPMTVMCNSTAVRSYSLSECFWALVMFGLLIMGIWRSNV